MTTEAKNKEQIFDETISPLLDQIRAICEQHEIPFCASFSIPTEDRPDLIATAAKIFGSHTGDTIIAGCMGMTMEKTDLPPRVAAMREHYLILVGLSLEDEATTESAAAKEAHAH